MNLSKFMKGTMTVPELEQLPNRYIQTIYKEYYKTMQSEEAAEDYAKEQAAEEMIESMGG